MIGPTLVRADLYLDFVNSSGDLELSPKVPPSKIFGGDPVESIETR